MAMTYSQRKIVLDAASLLVRALSDTNETAYALEQKLRKDSVAEDVIAHTVQILLDAAGPPRTNPSGKLHEESTGGTMSDSLINYLRDGTAEALDWEYSACAG